MTIPLAIGAIGTATIVQEMLAEIAVGLAVGLGIVVLYALIFLLVVVTVGMGVRYVRNR